MESIQITPAFLVLIRIDVKGGYHILNQQFLSLGTIIVQLPWLVVVSLIWIFSKLVDRWFDLGKSKWSDLAVQAILVYFFIYKVSPLFLSFKSILSQPQSLFFLTGSIKGFLIAGIMTFFYVWILLKRKGVSPKPFFEAFTLVALLVYGGYSFIFQDLGEVTSMPWGLKIQDGSYLYHPLHYYRFLFLLAIFLFWWIKRKVWNQTDTRFLLVSGGVGLLMISSLDYKFSHIDALTFEQWVFISVAVLGWIHGLVIGDKAKRKGEIP